MGGAYSKRTTNIKFIFIAAGQLFTPDEADVLSTKQYDAVLYIYS